MSRKKNLLSGLTEQEELFCQEYIKEPIMYNALIKAYPAAKNWKRNSADVQANKILNRPKVNQRIKELLEKKESTLQNSTTLSKRKLIETALQMLEDTNNGAERQHAVALLKMLFQKEGLLQPQTQVNVNVNNSNTVNEVIGYLDL